MNTKTRVILVFVIANLYCFFLFVSYLFEVYKKYEQRSSCMEDIFNDTCSILSAQAEWDGFREKHKTKLAAIQKKKIDPGRILILIVIEYGTDLSVYRRAISTVDCYRRIHGYTFMIVSDRDYRKSCSHKDKFFRRHCISAILLLDYEYLLFIDADVGVVNPERRIEEYLDERFDVYLYDRFHNPEVAAGSYIVKNTPFAISFLNGFADYEWKLMNGTLHGTDNGALHAFLVDQIIGESDLGRKFCIDVWHASQNFPDLFAFEACVRALLGRREDFGKIKITKRLVGWMRDSWLTNSLWNPKMDFLLHGWKRHQYKTYDPCDLPIDISVKEPSKNIFPLAGEIQIDLCKPGNTTWKYDPNLIVPEKELRKEYAKMIRRVEANNLALLGHAQKVLKLKYVMWE